MAHEVLEVVALPVFEEREVHPGVTVQVPTGESIRKEPGDSISNAEWEAAHQTEDDIKALVDSGAVQEKS